MAYRYFINPLEITRHIMENYLMPGMFVCDCTMGNGFDTVRLSKLVGADGLVYSFDIQDLAITNTKKRLEEESEYHNVTLIKDGHENIDKYIDKELDFIIYNLGYLPKGDKTIVTRKENTLISIEKSLKLLKTNGILLITCYVGHDGGRDEKEAVELFLSKLNQKDYNVLEFNFINQINEPPILYGIEKR